MKINKILASILTIGALTISTPLLANTNQEAKTTPSTFKAEVKYVDVNSVKLAYYTRGTGSPIVMIMGFAGTMSMWDPILLEELSKEHELIIFDNRGAGLSTDTKENNTTIPQMADDTAALVKALGYKKVNILGWSMGARIGQQFVIRHPELTDKIILAAANPGGKHNIPISKAVSKEVNNPDLSLMANVELLYPNTPAGKEAAKQTLARVKAATKSGEIPDNFIVSKETKVRQARARNELWDKMNSNFQDLKKIKSPVLLTDGNDDIIDNPKNSPLMATQIPFSWLAFFEGGHAYLFQSHTKFSNTVNNFLNNSLD